MDSGEHASLVSIERTVQAIATDVVALKDKFHSHDIRLTHVESEQGGFKRVMDEVHAKMDLKMDHIAQALEEHTRREDADRERMIQQQAEAMRQAKAMNRNLLLSVAGAIIAAFAKHLGIW